MIIFPGDAAEYSKHLFRVLDTDNDNMVSWKEVMVGFHQLSPNGDPDAKLRLVYSVSSNLYCCFPQRNMFLLSRCMTSKATKLLQQMM